MIKRVIRGVLILLFGFSFLLQGEAGAQMSATELSSIARDAVSAGNYDEAVRFYLKALGTLDSIETDEGGEICLQLAIVYRQSNKLDEARRYAGIAADILKSSSLGKSAKNLYVSLGGKASDIPSVEATEKENEQGNNTVTQPQPQPQTPQKQPVREEAAANPSPQNDEEPKTKNPSSPENTSAEEPKSKEHFVVVEKMPELIGGLRSLYQNVEYPERARRMGIEGRVIIQFIVNEQGEVKNPKILRGIGYGCDEAALEAVKNITFEPGTQRGKPVRVLYTLPITFKLTKN